MWLAVALEADGEGAARLAAVTVGDGVSGQFADQGDDVDGQRAAGQQGAQVGADLGELARGAGIGHFPGAGC